MENLVANLNSVKERVARAAAAAGRNPGDIKLLAVSKMHPVSVLEEAMDAGITVFGENKVQEAESKIAVIGREKAEWHLIGHLQSNKARKAVQLFDVIHSLDSVDLATRLDRICGDENRAAFSVFVQVDLALEETKSGIREDELPELIGYLRSSPHLSFDGLMILPPYLDNPENVRPYFRRLRGIRDRLFAEDAFTTGRGELSMGMSHDFEIAIEEGATIVRIGTAIFGERSKY